MPQSLRSDQYYNADGTLDSFYNWDGQNTIYQSYGYAYNADHQIIGYNALGHLTSDTRTDNYAHAKTYSVDGAGNRLSMNENGAVTTLSEDADDELNSAGGTGSYGYTYNANGDQITSTINGAQTTYAYDFDDQLVSITKSGSTVTFRYDALGRQVSRAVNGALTGYYLDGNSILEEKGPAGTVQYTWGNGLIRRGSEYPMTDGQGTTKLETSSSQSVTSTQETEAFGRFIGGTGSTGSPFGYHGGDGYRSDGDGPAGLEPYQKVGARYYDATFGRFITRDTDLTQSPYAYCNGDPVNCADPSGHDVDFGDFGLRNDGPRDFGPMLWDTFSADYAASLDDSNAPINLSGVVKGTVTTQGNKTTTTGSASVTGGNTTVQVTVIQVNTPFHDPITTAGLGVQYQFSSTTSAGLGYTTGAPGQAPTFTGSFAVTFGPSKPKPK